MPDINFGIFHLYKLFDNKRGNSSYTKKYCNNHVGQYEVYTGTTIGSFGKINTFDYDTPQLTYTTDGEYAGTVKLLEGKYNVGGHRAVLISKDDKLNLKYFENVLETIFKNVTKDGSVPSITWNIIKDINIPVPILEDGTYDFEAQQEIAQKYKTLLEKQNKLIEHKTKLEKSLIEADFAQNYNHNEILISELFTTIRGTGKYTKTYCNQHKGSYPVYSSNTKENFFSINSFDFDGNYLTWSTDGLAGYIHVVNGKFSATDHRGVLVPKEGIDVDNLDTDYLKYIIEPIFRKHIKGRMGHDGQNEYTSLKLNAVNKIKQKISIPVKPDGTYDLEAQQEIAKKYKKIEEVKKGICDKIDQLVKTKVSLVS